MNKSFSKLWRNSSRWMFAMCMVASLTPLVHAADAAPDWLRQLSKVTLPKYPDEANAVVLLDDETLTVRDNGEMYVNYRRAVKILRPGGKSEGEFVAFFDKDTKIESIHAWSISPMGQEFELKDKDAVETSPWKYAGFDDTRVKVMKVPAAEVGSYVAVEYQQRWRPYAFSRKWHFQERVPVKTARFSVNLPAGWEYQYKFGNWDEKKPINTGGNSWTWEIDDIPGIEREEEMPAIGSIAGVMVVSFFSSSLQATRVDTWNDVARWSDALNAPRRIATPKIQAKVAELTAGRTTTIDKARELANYVQRNIRYVAIEVGIGGFQAHMAGDTFNYSYGDCKDKATLLMTMLQAAGVESYFLLVDDRRGVVNPAVPTPWAFNHVIVAIKIPAQEDATTMYAHVDDPKLGRLLIFDPTNQEVPFGMIPGYEQNSYALVVATGGGTLIKMPTLAPALNRLIRTAHLELNSDGSLTGDIQEMRSGEEAARMRERLEEADRDKRVQYFEHFLAEYLDRPKLTYASITGLDKHDEPLVLHYKFVAPDYAKIAGDLILVRPRVLGNRASTVAEDKKRKYPVSYERTLLQSDLVDIKLPQGYQVDELPTPVEVTTPFAEYKSKIEAKDNVLYYNRSYTVKDLLVPLDQMGTLRTFMRGVATDERNTAVLKKAQ